MSDTPLLEKIENFEGDNENGVIYIDIHTPIITYEPEITYGPQEFWGKTGVMFEGSIQPVKFRIEVKTLKEAVDLYDQRCEETVTELQKKQKQKIVSPHDRQ